MGVDNRICLDAREINKAIQKEKFPIPTVDSLLDSMSGCKYFSKIDLKNAYTQIELSEEARKLTNFMTEEGIKRYTRLIYGISNASEIFQRCLEQTLGGIDGVRFISDDTIVFSKTLDEHFKCLENLFNQLTECGLTINKSKCEFLKSELKFFGVKLTQDGVKPDQDKINILQNASPPSNVNEVRRFLGLCTFMSRFIPNFSQKTADLRELLKKDAKFIWTDRQSKAYEILKSELTSDSVLAYYDPVKLCILVTDACNTSIGTILLQKHPDGERPVAYVGRSLTDAEKKYSTTECESLALVWAIEKLHLYLYQNHFTARVDHRPLEYIFGPKAKSSARMERWQLRLQPYNFDVEYHKGTENISDFISRIKNSPQPDDKTDQTNLYVNFIIQYAVPKRMTLEQIQAASLSDSEIVNLTKAIITGKFKENNCAEYQKYQTELTEQNGIVLRNNRIIIPKVLRNQALLLAHTGHLGIVKAKQHLRTKVFWPGIDKDIEQVIHKCLPCQAVIKDHHPLPEIKFTEVPQQAWEETGADFYGPLPDNSKLLVILDYFSKYPIIEIMQTTTAHSVINRLNKIFAANGFPQSMLTDNGPPWKSDAIKQYFKSLGIKHKKITPLWPRANGLTERFMQSINKTVRTAVIEKRSWKDALQNMLLMYHTTPHSTTKITPAKLFFN